MSSGSEEELRRDLLELAEDHRDYDATELPGISSSLGPDGAPSLPAPARALLSLQPVRGLLGVWSEHVKRRKPSERIGRTHMAGEKSVK